MSFSKLTRFLIVVLFPLFPIGCGGVEFEPNDIANEDGNEITTTDQPGSEGYAIGFEEDPEENPEESPWENPEEDPVEGPDFEEPTPSPLSTRDDANPGDRHFSESQVEALHRLEIDSWEVPQIRMEGGIPRFVSAQVPLKASLSNDPEAQALDFLEGYRDLYRLEDPLTQFKLERIATDAETEVAHLFFGQHQDGISVFAAELAIHVHGDNVIATNGNYLPQIPRFPEAVLDADEAMIIALRDIASGDRPGEEIEAVEDSELMVFNKGLISGGEAETHLAWRLNLQGMGTSWLTFVDAHNGDLLFTLDEERLHAPDKDIEIMTANNTESGSCWRFPWETSDDGVADQTTDPNSIQDSDARNALIFAHQVYDYFYDNFDRHSWDDDDEQVEVMVHVGNNLRDAAYRNGCEMIELGDGMVTLDILAHEFTHGVTDHTADLIYADESGALNESYSDVFAAMVDTANWTIGEGSAVGTARNMRSPPASPAFSQPDHMLTGVSGDGRGLIPPPAGDTRDRSNDFGSVHINSGIPNKAAYLIAEGGTHNGVVVTGIGREKTQRLYYDVLTMLLTENSEFRDARDLTVLWSQLYAQAGLFGFTGQDVCSVVNAFASVGLGNPDSDCDGLSDDFEADDDGDSHDDGVDNCPTIANPNQADNDRDLLGDVCDNDDDNDTLPDSRDNCPLEFNNGQGDIDFDGRGDVCDDSDGDGREDADDNCPFVSNPHQTNIDRDFRGDACDPDDDNDGWPDVGDNCPTITNRPQHDIDGDGRGDACDTCNDRIDADADGVGDTCDNCPTVTNPDQANSDTDSQGNSCDWDDDNDGVTDSKDNCPIHSNPDQQDNDTNGVGLTCDRGEQYMLTGSKEGWWNSLQDVIDFQLKAGAMEDLVNRGPTISTDPVNETLGKFKF